MNVSTLVHTYTHLPSHPHTHAYTHSLAYAHAHAHASHASHTRARARTHTHIHIPFRPTLKMAGEFQPKRFQAQYSTASRSTITILRQLQVLDLSQVDKVW